MAGKLTDRDIATLKAGARHADGVMSPHHGANFGRRNAEARMAKLVAAGLAQPNPHGDWYITAAGRAAIEAKPPAILHPKKPCAECPWRRDVKTGRFGPDRYRALANTAEDMSSRIFSCHKSAEDKPTACAGFILRGARHNLSLRLAYSRGDIGEVADGGYPLFDNFRQMAEANGVARTDPALRHCRDD